MIVSSLISIKAKDANHGIVYFLTWGNIFDSPQEVLDIVAKNKDQFPLHNPLSFELCESLQEASSAPYFYEALWHFSQEKIPQRNYEAWKEKMRKKIEQGTYIYFLGIPKHKYDAESRIKLWKHSVFTKKI